MAKKTPQKPIKPTATAKEIQTPSQSRTRYLYLTLAGVLLFTAFLYWPSLQNGFTNWDDDVYVTANEHLVFDAKNLKTLATKQVAGNFHPLTMWSLALDRGSDATKAPEPKPFHSSNLLLHLLNTALVFFLVCRLKFAVPIAAITALFFAIHPMHVESVAWVSGRKDVLFTAFFLGALISLTHYLERRKTSIWLLTFGLFILSCLSKPAAIVFPAVAWLIQWYQQPETARSYKKLLYLAPFFAASAFFSYLTIVYQQDIGAVDEQFGILKRSLFAGFSYVAYLWKLFLPIDLSPFHPAPLANESLGNIFYFTAIAALAVLGLTVYAYRLHRLLFFALAFYLLNLILVLGFIKVGAAVMAERYTYISYTGLFLFLAWASMKYAESGKTSKILGWAAVAAFAGYWAWTTSKQIPVWRNSENLWTQIVNQYPTERCLSYRGYARYLDKNWAKALEDFDRAYALDPTNQTTVHIRSICLEKLGRLEESHNSYSEYEKNFAPKADVYFQHANQMYQQKRNAEAITLFEKGLALDPKNIVSWTNLATCYFAEKHPVKAEFACNKALEINPNFLVALNNRGALRLSMGKYDEAIQDLTKSLSIKADQPQTAEYLRICRERVAKVK